MPTKSAAKKDPKEVVTISLTRAQWSVLTTAIRAQDNWQATLGRKAWKTVVFIDDRAHVAVPPPVFDLVTYARNKAPGIIEQLLIELKTSGKNKTAKETARKTLYKLLKDVTPKH